jgi:nicotinate-nucleotide pyrophosphorylase (carboxylating)
LYQKSRRGGLDKAALARRRLRLQSEAEQKKEGGSQITIGMGIGEQMTPAQSVSPQTTPDGLQEVDVSANEAGLSNFSVDNLSLREQQPAPSKELSFQINDERLLELYYEYFWPAFPVVLPQQHFQVRRLSPNHGLGDLSLVLEWIGSLYASWCPSEPYYKAALGAMTSPSLLHTPFNVQALMLFAIAQHHQDLRPQSRETLDRAILIALELDMNKREFARAYGEGDPVLEESWRRTWYILSVVDQHFAIVSNSPIYQLANMPNEVDLPCDDEFFEAGVSGGVGLCCG